jgi:KDO2-lipid IV(A) lauroyltransferase
VAVDNIRRCQEAGSLPAGLDAARTARLSFMGLGRTAAESFRLMHRGYGHFDGRVSITGAVGAVERLIEGARNGGPGIIFMTAHAGNWELSSAAMPKRFGISLDAVGRSQGRVADHILTRVRTQGGGRLIFKDGGAREMLRILKGGGFLGTLFDQADIVGTGGAKLSFMGRPAVTTLGPPKLAARTGASMVPLLCRRDGAEHHIEILDPLGPPTDPKDREPLLAAAQKLNDLLSDFIRRHPEQWMWSHRRWKMPEKFRDG